MVMVKLGYSPKEKNSWKPLPNDFSEKEYNGKLVIQINVRLWEKVQNLMYIRSQGYDGIICIDGDRRTGKSTLGKTIAYLLDPNITIENYVAGLEEAPKKIDNAKDESVLIFDEGSLVSNSKDVMKVKNVQLSKIIDVCGVKKLTLIFCMPSFFSISRDIAVHYSRFLLHVYTDVNLKRGRFAYFSKSRKKRLYDLGKKNFGSYSKPKASWTGLFVDFVLPFEKEYLQLKKESLQEALTMGTKKGGGVLDKSKYKTELMLGFKQNCPEIPDKIIAKGFGISLREYYRRKSGTGSLISG